MDGVNSSTSGSQVTQSEGANKKEHWGSDSDSVKQANENGGNLVMAVYHGEWGKIVLELQKGRINLNDCMSELRVREARKRE
jgi:hypothetical protein